jgi:hypothetical protein
MKPIRLSFEQELDVELAIQTEDPDGLDADSAAYVIYNFLRGPVPSDKLLARTCGDGGRCVNPDHMILVDRRANGR